MVEGAFEPIIGRDTFQRAQVLFRATPPRSPRRQTGYDLPLFYRKIVCGVCGQGLVRQKGPRIYYRCREKHGPVTGRCKTFRIYEDDLTAAVLSELQKCVASVCTVDENEKVAVGSTVSLEAQIAALELQIEKQWSVKKDSFVKWDGGMISKTAYEDICAEKRMEIQRLNQELERLKSLLTSGQRAEDAYQGQLAGDGGPVELTRQMVGALVETVRVFDGGWVEVVWKPKGNIAAVGMAFAENAFG